MDTEDSGVKEEGMKLMKHIATFITFMTGVVIILSGITFGVSLIMDGPYMCMAPWSIIATTLFGSALVYSGYKAEEYIEMKDKEDPNA